MNRDGDNLVDVGGSRTAQSVEFLCDEVMTQEYV